MSDSINPRCPVHGVSHKRPMCDPDEIREVILKRPYEVGDQQDTDLDADLANRLYDEVLRARDEGEAQRD